MVKLSTFLFFLAFLISASQSHAQAPRFTSNFYNPCGNDGNNEFLVGKASLVAGFDPMKLFYFVSGSNANGSGRDSIYQDAFCSSLTATGSGSNACNGAGWTKSSGVGSGSHRILNYTNATDKLKVDSVVARLNYRLASCTSGSCGSTFVAPDPTTGQIPAGANFVFFISQGINDTATGASSAVDFCGFCSDGPFYVIVGSFPPGTSGLVTNTYTATTTRYISLAYDFGAPTGLTEIYSYVHTPSSTSVGGRNYFQAIPQGVDSLINLTAQNYNTIDCSIAANIALPLKLTLFNGSYKDNSAQLHWNISSGDLINAFEVQRSNDGVDFNAIANITARAGSSNKADYYYTDFSPPADKGYYRLKLLDVDGDFEYSNVLQVLTLKSVDDLSIYPNPADKLINLSLPGTASGVAYFFLSNASGVIVKEDKQPFNMGQNKFILSVEGLPPGVYFLKTEMGGLVNSRMFLKK